MSPLILALVGLASLVILIVVVRLHAFPALLLVSIGVGLGAGMDGLEVLDAVEKGMSGTLGFIAVVVGLGAMLGQMLESSGGATILAESLVERFGESKAPLALTITGVLVAIPVFFDVGFIILIPLIMSLARRYKRPVVVYAIPLLAGLAVAHAFVPPTPGPVAVAKILGAELGRVILFGLAAGVPAAIIGGPLLVKFLEKQVPVMAPPQAEAPDKLENPPPVLLILTLMTIPMVLMVAGSLSKTFAPEHHLTPILGMLGHPFTALLLATLLAFYALGTRRGLTKNEVQALASKALQPTGLIILVTGAGAVFKQILGDSGVGQEVAKAIAGLGFPTVLFAFTVALVVRVAQGSATVSMLTAAGFVEPLLQGQNAADPALITIAIAAGATACSHFNDSGFWLVKEYLGLSEVETLKSWTLASTVVGFTGLVFAWLASWVL